MRWRRWLDFETLAALTQTFSAKHCVLLNTSETRTRKHMMRTSRSCGGGFRATRSAATISSPTNALPRPKGPRATEADAVTETKKAAGEEAVAVAEAMKDRSGQARNFASAAARCASSSSTTRRSGMPCCGYCCRTPGGTASGIPALGHYLYTDETKSVGGALGAAVFHSLHLHSELTHRVQAHPPLART